MAKKIVGLLNVYKTGFLQANKVKVTYDRHVAGLQAIADSLGIKSKGKGKNLKEKAKAEMKAQLKKLADEIVDNMGAAVAESVSEQLNKEISEEWATLGMPFGISPLFKHLDKFVLKISKGACKKGFDATTKAMGVTDADADEGLILFLESEGLGRIPVQIRLIRPTGVALTSAESFASSEQEESANTDLRFGSSMSAGGTRLPGQ